MNNTEKTIRQEMTDQCRWLSANGFNQGTSGNISVRFGADQLLITPSGVDYGKLEPEMMVLISIDAINQKEVSWCGQFRPSTEYPFHCAIMHARPEISAIVHTHSTFATILSIGHHEIPPCHYLIATLGGAIRCTAYARFGSAELSRMAVEAIDGRLACLLGNHGAIALGTTLKHAIANAVQLEVLSRQYYSAKAIGHVHLLTDQEILEVKQEIERIKYGEATD